ncbi:hypothetical protein [Nocardia brasiliensis]|uniref:hypothetical protein n=1 Tax=Nocardia brasiliensis TaxID=37326 RepID=UPI003D8FB3B1
MSIRTLSATTAISLVGLVLWGAAAGGAAAAPPAPTVPCTKQNLGQQVRHSAGTWVCLAPAAGTGDPYSWEWFPLQ